MDLESAVREALKSFPEMMKAAEAAAASRCSPRTISRYIALGRLKVCHPAANGGVVLIPKEALIACLCGKCQDDPPGCM